MPQLPYIPFRLTTRICRFTTLIPHNLWAVMMPFLLTLQQLNIPTCVLELCPSCTLPSTFVMLCSCSSSTVMTSPMANPTATVLFSTSPKHLANSEVIVFWSLCICSSSALISGSVVVMLLTFCSTYWLAWFHPCRIKMFLMLLYIPSYLSTEKSGSY